MSTPRPQPGEGVDPARSPGEGWGATEPNLCSQCWEMTKGKEALIGILGKVTWKRGSWRVKRSASALWNWRKGIPSREHSKYYISNLRYADDTILMAESKEKLKSLLMKVRFSSVHSLSHVQLFAVPWTAAHQASLSITNSQSLLKFMSIESVIPSNHLILCHCLLLLPSILPSTRVFSSESALHIRWPKHWSFSFSISPSNEYSGLISFRMD